MGLFSKRENLTKKSNKVVTPNTEEEFIQARADRDSYSASTAMSIGAIVMVIVGLVLFFMSDIPNKVISAKSTPVVATTEVIDDDESDESDAESSQPEVNYTAGDSYVIATLPGIIQSIDQDELLAQIEDMDEAEYDTFIASLAELLSSDNPEEVLRDMDPEVSIYFNSGSNGDASSTSSASESEAGSVVDAYDVADELFGDAIDGSQRIKLIEELNAVDYKYYVAEDGDTLLELSQVFDIGLGQLVELNGMSDADELPAGMIIILPSETVVDDNDKVVNK